MTSNAIDKILASLIKEYKRIGTLDAVQLLQKMNVVGDLVHGDFLTHAVELVRGHIRELIAGGLIVAGTAMLLPAIGLLILEAVGFTAAGVAAGSLAAALQSAIYGGFTTGVFSILQSVGATAVAVAHPLIAVGVTVLAVGVGIAVLTRLRKEGHLDGAEIKRLVKEVLRLVHGPVGQQLKAAVVEAGKTAERLAAQAYQGVKSHFGSRL